MYPNREHEKADKAAKRRAITTLVGIIQTAQDIYRRVDGDLPVYASDTHVMFGDLVKVNENLTILEILRDVREWHAADQADSS